MNPYHFGFAAGVVIAAFIVGYSFGSTTPTSCEITFMDNNGVKHTISKEYR